MRKYLLLHILALFFIQPALSQEKKEKTKQDDIQVDKRFKGAIIAGMNLTQVDGDEVYGFKKIGFNGGFAAIIPLFHRFSLSIETIFNQKGAYCKYPIYVGDTQPIPYYKLELNYLDVPVLIMFEDKSTWTFGTGLSWGALVGKKEMEHGSWIDSNLVKYPYRRGDLQWLFDIRFRIWKHLKFNLRYSYTLTPIRYREFNNGVSQWGRNQYNNVITFRLLYILNEKYLPPRYKFTKKKKTKPLTTPASTPKK